MIVAIHTVMRDTYEPYLFEWLNYHHSIGVDRFFLYDNESKIPLTESIKSIPFKDNIFVSYIPGVPSLKFDVQRGSYLYFLGTIRDKSFPKIDRVAFIDEDEFIICKNNDIKAILSNYLEYPGLAINWRMFGSSGLLEQTPILQMEKFVWYAPNYQGNVNIKSIVNPYLIESVTSPHTFTYTQGFCVDTDKKPIEGFYIMSPIYKEMWINHYWTRSLAEWNEKVLRGQANTGQKRESSMFDELNILCTEHV